MSRVLLDLKSSEFSISPGRRIIIIIGDNCVEVFYALRRELLHILICTEQQTQFNTISYIM